MDSFSSLLSGEEGLPEALSDAVLHLDASWRWMSVVARGAFAAGAACCLPGCEAPAWKALRKAAGAVPGIIMPVARAAAGVATRSREGRAAGLLAFSCEAAMGLQSPFGRAALSGVLDHVPRIVLSHVQQLGGCGACSLGLLGEAASLSIRRAMADVQDALLKGFLKGCLAEELSPNSGRMRAARQWAGRSQARWLALTAAGFPPGPAAESVVWSMGAPWLPWRGSH